MFIRGGALGLCDPAAGESFCLAIRSLSTESSSCGASPPDRGDEAGVLLLLFGLSVAICS